MPALRPTRRVAIPAFVAALALASAAHGAHPLISEDTATQGHGHIELELGTQTSHVEGAARIRELDPQLSYGARDDLDVILRPSYFRLGGAAADAAGRRSGFGATALDVKWRAAAHGSWSIGTRAGVDLPTASDGLGARQPGAHALAMATYDAAPLVATMNVAYTRLPRDATDPDQRRNVWRLSAGALLALSSTVRLAGDLALARAAETTERGWPAIAVIGLIVHTPMGFDVDAGYQLPLNRIAPSGAWLLGATLRW